MPFPDRAIRKKQTFIFFPRIELCGGYSVLWWRSFSHRRYPALSTFPAELLAVSSPSENNKFPAMWPVKIEYACTGCSDSSADKATPRPVDSVMEIPSARRLITVAPAHAVSRPVSFLSSNPVQSQSRNLVIPGRVYVITRKTVFTSRGDVISKHPDCPRYTHQLRFTMSNPRCSFPPLSRLYTCNSDVVSIDTSIATREGERRIRGINIPVRQILHASVHKYQNTCLFAIRYYNWSGSWKERLIQQSYVNPTKQN